MVVERRWWSCGGELTAAVVEQQFQTLEEGVVVEEGPLRQFLSILHKHTLFSLPNFIRGEKLEFQQSLLTFFVVFTNLDYFINVVFF